MHLEVSTHQTRIVVSSDADATQEDDADAQARSFMPPRCPENDDVNDEKDDDGEDGDDGDDDDEYTRTTPEVRPTAKYFDDGWKARALTCTLLLLLEGVRSTSWRRERERERGTPPVLGAMAENANECE